MKQENHDVGVIVGRFQVPELHTAHKDLFQAVLREHDKVLVYLGLSPLKATARNPLDYEARKQMILEAFPQVNVFYVKDMPTDDVWSQQLDGLIDDVIHPGQTVMLYGGRDSFIEHYEGVWPTRTLESDRPVAGRTIRNDVSRRRTRASADFRAGAIWAAHARFPTNYTTVDVGVFDEEGEKILLARKRFEKQWRLPGGFAHWESPSLEADARREVAEETGLTVTDPEYVGSFQIDDWRYRLEQDKIKTALFRAKRLMGVPNAGDDVDEVRWFEVGALSDSDIVPNHRELIHALIPQHSER